VVVSSGNRTIPPFDRYEVVQECLIHLSHQLDATVYGESQDGPLRHVIAVIEAVVLYATLTLKNRLVLLVCLFDSK